VTKWLGEKKKILSLYLNGTDRQFLIGSFLLSTKYDGAR